MGLEHVSSSTLPLTGERTLPGIAEENYWFRRHEAAYLLLREELSSGPVLEIGAGEDYGAALLAERCPDVCALDYDAAAIGHLARRYPAVHALRGNLAALPFATASAGTVVSLQVIEHVWDHPQFLAECRRVLRPGGSLILSTPNRLTFSPGPAAPVNPFHTHEFTAAELRRLVSDAGFADIRLRGLQASPRLLALDVRHPGGLVAAQLASAPEAWPEQLRRDVASVRADDFVLSEQDIDDSLDLVLVGRCP